MQILVTGGAGFIGSYIVDGLIESGIDVVVIDSLEEQVHKTLPSYLNPKATYYWSTLSNVSLLKKILSQVDAVCHQASLVGVGQSMYEIARYNKYNNQHTSILAEQILKFKNIKRIVLASSVSVYGEGKYLNSKGVVVRPFDRISYSRKDSFELYDTYNEQLIPVAITEEDSLNPSSIYGLTKLTQEKIFTIMGQAYNIPTVAFRYFGVYGNRQSLSNSYSGLMAICSSRIINGHAPIIFEDGNQTRDFIHVRDVARANVLALSSQSFVSGVYNLASGKPVSINNIANHLCKVLNPNIKPMITNEYRKGDIRHCFGNISKVEKDLDFTPLINIEAGLDELAHWAKFEKSYDHLEEVNNKLKEANLLLKR